jgi:hypothetical protein
MWEARRSHRRLELEESCLCLFRLVWLSRREFLACNLGARVRMQGHLRLASCRGCSLYGTKGWVMEADPKERKA